MEVVIHFFPSFFSTDFGHQRKLGKPFLKTSIFSPCMASFNATFVSIDLNIQSTISVSTIFISFNITYIWHVPNRLGFVVV
ncbi:hypothetical protein V6Z11_D09G077700 [Gossypium hirsutum]